MVTASGKSRALGGMQLVGMVVSGGVSPFVFSPASAESVLCVFSVRLSVPVTGMVVVVWALCGGSSVLLRP